MMVLEKDDKRSLALFLCHNLVKYFKLNDTEAAEMAAVIV